MAVQEEDRCSLVANKPEVPFYQKNGRMASGPSGLGTRVTERCTGVARRRRLEFEPVYTLQCPIVVGGGGGGDLGLVCPASMAPSFVACTA